MRDSHGPRDRPAPPEAPLTTGRTDPAHIGREPAPLALRLAGIAGVAVLLLFPLLGGILPIRDDWSYCLAFVRGTSVAAEITGRLKGDFFRPLDVVATSLLDPRTLDGRGTALLGAIAFVLFLAVLRVGIGRLDRRVPLPANGATLFWMVTLWLVMQSGSAVSLWQLDTGSQVWSAAAGVAFGLALWSWVERSGRGEPAGPALAGVLGLEVAGLLTKEVFLGWCASAVVVLGLLAVLAAREGTSRRARALAGAAAAITIVAIGYVAVRRALGGLEMGYGKYSGNVLVNSAKNTVLALVGGLTVGPLHALRDPRALPIVRPLVLAGLAGAMLFAVAGVVVLARMERERRGAGGLTALVVFVAAGSIAAVMPTEHISEVYLLGPNVGFGLLVALGALEVLRRRRALGILAIAAVLVAGAFGTFARLRQFAATWQEARAIQAEARDAIASLPAAAHDVVLVPGPVLTATGYVHSTYVMPPGETMPPAGLAAWLERVFPGRRVRIGEPLPGENAPVVHLTGRGIGERPRY